MKRLHSSSYYYTPSLPPPYSVIFLLEALECLTTRQAVENLQILIMRGLYGHLEDKAIKDTRISHTGFERHCHFRLMKST